METIGLASPIEQRRSDLAGWLTVERVSYLILVLAGAFVRLYGLGWRPLSTLEAANSWSAWAASTGLGLRDLPVASGSLLYSFQVWLFWIAGSSDVQARLIPAIAGTLLVILPWWLRGFLGRPTALCLTFLFAIDPWLVAFSRLADGAILSALLAVTVLLGLVMLTRNGSVASGELDFDGEAASAPIWSPDRWSLLVAVSSGLLLVSGHIAWSFVLILLVYVGLYHRELGSAFVPRKRLLLWSGGAMLLGATAWLSHPDGLGLVSSSLSMWLAELGHTGSSLFWAELGPRYSPGWPLLRLIVDQPLLVLMGVTGLVYLFTADAQSVLHIDRRWPMFLWIWLAWGFLLLSLPGRNPFDLVVMQIPLLFGAAYTGMGLLRMTPLDLDWREGMVVAATLSVLTVSGGFWIVALVFKAQFDPVIAQAAAIILLLSLIIVAVYAMWSGWQNTVWVVGLFMVAVLLLVSTSSSWQLNHRFDITKPDGFFAEFTHPDVVQMVRDIGTLSAQRVGDATEIPIHIQMNIAPGTPAKPRGSSGKDPATAPEAHRDPLIGWYLRSMRRVTWDPEGGASASHAEAADGPAPLVITGAVGASDAPKQVQSLHLPNNYIGSVYDLRANWLPAQIAGSVRAWRCCRA